MSLSLSVKALVVVVAVMLGTAAEALAHAGHSCAPVAADAGRLAPIASAKPIVRDAPGPIVRQSPFPAQIADGPPGACCCQGVSACGMGGHCSATLAPDLDHRSGDPDGDARYRLTRLGLAHSDVVIGLDRPPKA